MAGLFLTNYVGGLLQRKPKVPKFVPIDVQREQVKAVEGNIQALPKLETMASDAAKVLGRQLRESIDEFFPGFQDIIDRGAREVESAQRGELPGDVQDVIARRASERGFATGTAGSEFQRSAELRDIGITSLQRISQGHAAAERWIALSRNFVPFVDISPFLITPTFQAQFAQEERNSQFNRDFLRSQINAEFDSRTILGRSIVETGNTITELLSSALGVMAGGGGGGGGGKFTFTKFPGASSVQQTPVFSNPPPFSAPASIGQGIPFQDPGRPQSIPLPPPPASPGETTPVLPPSFG